MDSLIRKALELFVDAGSVIEIRALNCWDSNPEYPCTRTGYFDDLDAAEKAVADLEAKWHPDGIYITLNPVKPDLLARSANRLRKGKKDEATANGDIIRRRWLLIDFDPVRPAGISASEDEVSLARASAMACWSWLTENGFPLPVVAMSGNGWHLLYRIELDADDAGLIKSCLAAIGAKWTSAEVSVDQKVFNAARITKLYGTLARKGDATKDRPHRRSELVEVPDELLVVSAEQLSRLATPQTETQPSQNGHSSEMLRVDSWLARHGVQPIKSDQTSDGSDRWFIRCPAIDLHTSKNQDADCCITRSPSGQLGGHCFHDSCGMRDWQSIKSAIGPVSYDDYHEPFSGSSGVNLDGLMRPATAKEPQLKSVEDEAFPDECLHPGGTLERIMEQNLTSAMFPMPQLALAGALALMSVVTGRKVQDRRGLRTNGYFLGLAPASGGKNNARQVNAAILLRTGAGDMLGPSKLKSSAGLVSSLVTQPACLFQLDEISRLLHTMKNPREAPHLYDIGTVMLEAWSEANTIWKPGAYADSKKNPTVDQPHLVIYGTAVAREFWSSLTVGSLEDGLVGRMMVFESPMLNDVIELDGIPVMCETLLAEVASWVGFDPQSHTPLIQKMTSSPVTISHTPEAWARQWEHIRKIVKGRDGETESTRGVWRRSGEKMGKLALLSACSRNPPISGNPLMVELRDVNWAIRLSNWLTRRLLTQAGLYVAENVCHDNLNRIMRLMGDWMSSEEIGQKVRWVKAKERKEIIDSAVSDGLVAMRMVKTDKRDRAEYIRADRINL